MKLITFLAIVFLSFSIQAQIESKDNIMLSTLFETQLVLDSIKEKEYASFDHSDPNILEFPNIPADFKGGYGQIANLIEANFTLSKRKLSKTIKKNGFVSLRFTFNIDSDDKLKNLELIDGSYRKLDEEIERILHLVEWQAGERHGARVNAACTLQIIFEKK